MANLFLRWTEKDNTGITVIDEQHRAVMAIINSFFFHRDDKDLNRFLIPTAETMKAFWLIHFRTEEELMRESEFPGYKEHVAEHLRVRNELWELEKECRERCDPMSFLLHLKKYWLNHVEDLDRKYVEHLRAWLGARA